MGEVHDELGAVRRERVLPDQDRGAVLVGGDPLAHQHGRPDGDLQQLGVLRAGGVGPDGLGGAAEGHGQQLVEGTVPDLRPADVVAELLGAPDRDPGEGLAVGQVHPGDLERLVHAEQRPHPGRRADERELADVALRATALGLQLGLDRAQVRERLADRRPGDEPAEALARVHQPLGPQGLERLADGHPRGAVGCRQLCFGRQDATRGELGSLDAIPEVSGDVPVADGAHLSHSCML
ncbi:MAG: hypothetical protein U0P45_06880 [Acidimicrobiales bacterium]